MSLRTAEKPLYSLGPACARHGISAGTPTNSPDSPADPGTHAPRIGAGVPPPAPHRLHAAGSVGSPAVPLAAAGCGGSGRGPCFANTPPPRLRLLCAAGTAAAAAAAALLPRSAAAGLRAGTAAADRDGAATLHAAAADCRCCAALWRGPPAPLLRR